jgi:hypothetical protein
MEFLSQDDLGYPELVLSVGYAGLPSINSTTSSHRE